MVATLYRTAVGFIRDNHSAVRVTPQWKKLDSDQVRYNYFLGNTTSFILKFIRFLPVDVPHRRVRQVRLHLMRLLLGDDASEGFDDRPPPDRLPVRNDRPGIHLITEYVMKKHLTRSDDAFTQRRKLLKVPTITLRAVNSITYDIKHTSNSVDRGITNVKMFAD